MTAHRILVDNNGLQINITDLSDDASTSSTITVDRIAKPLATSETAVVVRSKTPKKSVRFDDASNCEYENSLYCEEDTKDYWYDAEDYRHFKSSTMFMAKEIAKTEKNNQAPFSFQRVLMRTYEACCQHTHETNTSVLSVDEKKRLARWAEMATTRLGLERWSCRAINRDKSYRRNEVVNAVLEAQDSVFPDCDATELIRESSERVTRTSRLFARCLGEAVSGSPLC